MRTGEILALTWGDIDFKKHTININKTCTEGKLGLGKDPNWVKDMLGHKNLSMLLIPMAIGIVRIKIMATELA